MPPLTKGRAVYGDDADYPDTGVGASPLLATTESIGEDLSRNNAFRQEMDNPASFSETGTLRVAVCA